jgi:hypothetical protein
VGQSKNFLPKATKFGVDKALPFVNKFDVVSLDSSDGKYNVPSYLMNLL